MSAPSVSAAQISRAVSALEKAGHEVKAARLYPDGSIALLTEVAAEALPSTAYLDWVEMAGEQASSRA